MSKLHRTWIILMVVASLLAAVGVASADDEVLEESMDEQPAIETMVNFAYDLENHVFMVNTWTSDAAYNCRLEANTLTIGYGAAEDGSLTFTPAAGSGWNGECVLSGGVVGGPNGQINHGQFMKLFHQIVGKKGNGCLNRMIAQSDLGKGDQQIRTSDVEEGFEVRASGDVEFEMFTADCDHGKQEKAEDHPSNNQNKAKKDRDESPGNSGNARGRNK